MATIARPIPGQHDQVKGYTHPPHSLMRRVAISLAAF